MPRKRMIDPEFWSDEQIAKWSPITRLFYIGLWNFADDEGRFKAHPALLKSQIFPYEDTFNFLAIKNDLGEKIEWYDVGGSQYGYIRNFNKHQYIEKMRNSSLPIPPSLRELSLNGRGLVGEDSRLIEKNRIEKNRASAALVISYLNEKADKNFSVKSEANLKFIMARMSEGRTVDELKSVVDLKSSQWKGQEKMWPYLRPETLFNKTKFESYLNEKPRTKATASSQPFDLSVYAKRRS